MLKEFLRGFWNVTARIILRNRILILLAITAITIFMGLQWENMRFSNTEQSVLPDDHPSIVQYDSFVELFGQEDNAIVLAVRDSALFTAKNFNRWNRLSKQLQAVPEVDYVVSTDNLEELVKDEGSNSFLLKKLFPEEEIGQEELNTLRQHLYKELPFYENLLFNPETGAIRTILYMDRDLLNEPIRNDFILIDLTNLVEKFEEETGLDVHVSGMPYIRTWNSKIIIDEIGYFVLAALLVTSIIFFFFFRSFRATLR